MDLDKINIDDLDVIASWVATPIENQTEFENWVGNFLFGNKIEENRQWEYAVMIWRLSSDQGFASSVVSWAKSDPELFWIFVNGLKIDGVVEVENKFIFVRPLGATKVGKLAAEVDGNKVNFGDIAVFEKGKTIKLYNGLKIVNKSTWELTGEYKIIVDVRGEIKKGELLKWQKQIGL